MAVELSDAFFAKAAGWEAMKRARAYLDQDQVLSSAWVPPLLRGVVQAGEISFRAGLVIKGPIDIENICTCRDSREWGKICAHSVAVGLHFLKERQPVAAGAKAATRPGGTTSLSSPTPTKTSSLRRDAAGEPAELFLIFPPNFAQALARGKIMVCSEAQWSGGRVPLNALPRDKVFAFSAQDNRIIDRLEMLAAGQTPAMIMVEAKDFVPLLPLLQEHPRLTSGRAQAVEISAQPALLPLRATLEANGEIVLALRGRPAAPPVLEGGWTWDPPTLRPLGLPRELLKVSEGPVRLGRPQIPAFLSQCWPALAAGDAVEANFKLEDFSLEPRPPRFVLELKGGLAQLNALLHCTYGPRIMTVGVTAAQEGVWLPDPESPTRYSTRDFAAERAALARLQKAGFTGPDAQGKWQLNGQNAVLNFFAREYPRLQREWDVTMEERLERSTAQNLERIEPQFQISSSGVQWFDLGVVFATDSGEKFSAADIQRLVLSGQGHTRLKNGKIALVDTGAVEELQEVLLDCAPEQHAQGYRMNNAQAGFVEATLRRHSDWKVQANPAWRERAARQSGETALVCPPLGDLETVLRPYQKQGVAWLHFLRENSFGGILADEMGLGKTLQTLAFLRGRAASSPPSARGSGAESPPRLPSLVVCPTSLVFNWEAEARKFTPELRVLALHGPGRHKRFAEIAQCDLVVTSYALIRRDAERYREWEFDTVVLDEAQHIKNRQTHNAQAVKAVRSHHRLVLTGTPLENSVLDLWSIFDFLMPGYLGAAQDFRERYELPITRDRNVEAQARLARRLRPFMLRRLKRDVAPDLPPKVEQVAWCELTGDQRGVYQQVIEASRKEVLEAVGQNGLARSRMVVLNALLRLRQVCCDLRLLKLEKINPAEASGKLDMFEELLEEVIDGGHRVLVFSQFVSMLTILKERLTAEGVEFCYLDGSTTNRPAVIDRFQKDSSIPVFLISLKAGGVGLNLTGADTVIHFDPWWNPAVEDQATDRAHRIGQARVVTSYKLITRDTVEEKILALQNRKREIISATLGSQEQLAEALTWEEIQDLLGA